MNFLRKLGLAGIIVFAACSNSFDTMHFDKEGQKINKSYFAKNIDNL